MPPVPPAFLQSIKDHNRHSWAAAFFSLMGAFFAWLFFTAVYVGLALLIHTVSTGDTSFVSTPRWLIPLGCGLAVVLLVFASIDRWRRRFRPTSDRSIIGWHLFGEVLFLPPRLTYAIWDHIELRLRPTAWELTESWRLLQIIASQPRVPYSSLGQEFGDPVLLPRLLLILQLTGWIDLQRGEEDWYYYVPSDVLPRLQLIIEEIAA